MIRSILHETGQRIIRALTSDKIQTLSPPDPDRTPDLLPVVRSLVSELAAKQTADDMRRREVFEFMGELQEAALMGGSGPWLGPMTFNEAAQPGGMAKASAVGIRTRESFANAQGANGLFELELNNWEWRREINFGWLEFSRWGIQQIILLSRLYYIKNPIVRRLVDVCAIYVFGRAVEVSSPDEDLNEAIKGFMDRNQKVLGQAALTDLERRKDYDGNLFFAFFTNDDTGDTDVRTIDATEMQEIVTDPEDADTELLYKRQYFEKTFVTQIGMFETRGKCDWYPSLQYVEDIAAGKREKVGQVNGADVLWDIPVHHRKCGTAGKWLFGCPRIYPMLDWAKASRKFLEHCMAVKAALAQIAMTITTKGGQQALEGIKQQLQSTVATGNSSWYEQNPTAVAGSTWASGPGTTLAAFKSQGEGGDPEEVRQYKLMCCMVAGVPETFLADVSTGNLATATTLDRPTELGFKSKQEEWREDLIVIVKFAMRNQIKAPNGKVREALERRGSDIGSIKVFEAKRVFSKDGSWHYEFVMPQDGIVAMREAAKVKGATPDPEVMEITVTFPEIREGDVPALVAACVEAMTLGNKGGQVTGIDERAGVRHLYQLLGMDKADELTEDQYPESEYNANRADQKIEQPVQRAMPTPGGGTQVDPKTGKPIGATLKPQPQVEAAIERLAEAFAQWKKDKAA